MIRILRRKNREPNKKKKSSSSDDEVEGRGGCWFIKLPSEIIVEILCKLPTESVLKCKSVCKSWSSLISHHPCFVYLNYRLIFAKPSSGCISICHLGDVLMYDKSDGGTVVLEEFDETSPTSTAYIAASCNGLVCFLDYITPDILFIWNPSTSICSRSLSSGFDIKSYGFGYDKSSDDYKFFAASSKETTTSKISKIYSLKTGKWKNTTVDFPFHGLVYNADGKYSNGALHWATYNTSEEHSSSGHPWLISSLDLATETYGQVSHPEYGHAAGDAYVSSTLGALGDQWLCVLCYYLKERRSDIWVMKVKDSWAKLVSIPEYILDDHGGIIMFLPTMPSFITNDEKILFRYTKSRLILYDSKDGSDGF